jgi:hypothetical protein
VTAAVSDGSLNVLDGSDSGSFYFSRRQTLIMPRAEVKSELAAAQKRGMLARPVVWGDSGSFELSTQRRQAGLRLVRPLRLSDE